MYPMAEPYLYVHDAKLTLSHELVYRFIVFNPAETKIHFREIGLYNVGFGEKVN